MEENINKENVEKKKTKNVNFLKVIRVLFIQILLYVLFSISTGLDWAYESFDNCTLEKILFQLSEPLNGTSTEVIIDGIISIFGKAFLYLGIFNIVYFLIIKISKKVFKLNENIINILKFSLLLIIIVNFTVYSCYKSDLKTYINSIVTSSTFIEENYINPHEVKIKFPENKRNLVFIILESMEVSFMDKENGGALDINLIPEITTLMKENISFTNKVDGKLGGACDVAGTGWTIGALASETTGLPLKVAGFNTANDPNENFMPGALALGDVLKREGYNQMFICGSPIEFGGRDDFYKKHGDYEILDYNRATSEGKYTGEKVNWGFDDITLYDYVKEELLRLSKEDKPFNVTFLTADTHHPVGYLCSKCTNEYDYEYYNVVRCASRQLDEFVSWVKKQDFYDNTTIVILGDHPTMVSDERLGIPEDYTRTMVNCFINTAFEKVESKSNVITSMDFYPTILTSIGAKVEGNKLGLGTNLFSKEETVGDKFGIKVMDEEIRLRSEFYLNEILKKD